MRNRRASRGPSPWPQVLKVVGGFAVGFAIAMCIPFLPGWQPFDRSQLAKPHSEREAGSSHRLHHPAHDLHGGFHSSYHSSLGRGMSNRFHGVQLAHHHLGQGQVERLAHHAHGIHGIHSNIAIQRRPAGVLLRGQGQALPPPPHVDEPPTTPPPPAAAIDPPRICGSPAVDGYAHVNPKCLEDSPTASIWGQWVRQGHAPSELLCSIEMEADFDGLAVAWGPYHKKASVEECMEACRAHKPGPQVGGPFGNLPCNTFTFCPLDECFEPDAHHHTKGDCWLKFTEAPQNPEMNMRGSLEGNLRTRHTKAPLRTPWHGGVCLLPGMVGGNGTWGPRYKW